MHRKQRLYSSFDLSRRCVLLTTSFCALLEPEPPAVGIFPSNAFSIDTRLRSHDSRRGHLWPFRVTVESRPPSTVGMNVATTSSVSSIVAGWLSKSGGESGPSAAEPASSSAPSLFAPRPERLGLGAKFLSHSQAMPLHEQQFAKKLKQQVEKRERERGRPGRWSSRANLSRSIRRNGEARRIRSLRMMTRNLGLLLSSRRRKAAATINANARFIVRRLYEKPLITKQACHDDPARCSLRTAIQYMLITLTHTHTHTTAKHRPITIRYSRGPSLTTQPNEKRNATARTIDAYRPSG